MPISNQVGIIIGPALAGLALGFSGYGAIGLICLGIGIFGAMLTPLLIQEHQITLATKTLEAYSE
jgi:predicted MFS family arabinose efflux permease